jgi:hypothetical protein
MDPTLKAMLYEAMAAHGRAAANASRFRAWHRTTRLVMADRLLDDGDDDRADQLRRLPGLVPLLCVPFTPGRVIYNVRPHVMPVTKARPWLRLLDDDFAQAGIVRCLAYRELLFQLPTPIGDAGQPYVTTGPLWLEVMPKVWGVAVTIDLHPADPDEQTTWHINVEAVLAQRRRELAAMFGEYADAQKAMEVAHGA